MSKHNDLFKLVEQQYKNSNQEFARFMWQHHVPVVASWAQRLSEQFGANQDLAVAGALLHDYGDVFVHRHDGRHAEITTEEAAKVMSVAEYTQAEIAEVLTQVIAPHSCKSGLLPTTLEGKIMATSDAVAHLTTDFYLQFAWMHMPEGKTYQEYKEWVLEKINRDYNQKIFFDETRKTVARNHEALRLLFSL